MVPPEWPASSPRSLKEEAIEQYQKVQGVMTLGIPTIESFWESHKVA